MLRPILFNTEMVRAIQSGRKTVTRRVIKPQPTAPRRNNIGWLGWDDGHGYQIKAPCDVCDILWVRETWGTYNDEYFLYRADFPDGATTYEFDNEFDKVTCDLPRWRPSIHMPKHAARIFLRVTDIRAERLQDITHDDAWREGVEPESIFVSPRGAFAKLWDSTVKSADRAAYGWEADPWVWVIEFVQCEKPEEV